MSKKMPPIDSRQALKGALLCSLLSALLLQVAVGLECYSFSGAYTVSVSVDERAKLTCGPAQNVCAEGLFTLGIGGRQTVVVMTKGCHAGPIRDISTVSDGPYLPNYSRVRFCNTSLCNHRFPDSSSIPAFPTVPPANTSTSLMCYTCIGFSPEECSPFRAPQSHCYANSPRCYEATGKVTVGAFSVPIYLRSCQDSACASAMPGDPWLNIQLPTASCCDQPLCNHAPEPAPTASRPPRLTTSSQGPTNAGPRPGLPPATLLLLLGGLGLGG